MVILCVLKNSAQSFYTTIFLILWFLKYYSFNLTPLLTLKQGRRLLKVTFSPTELAEQTTLIEGRVFHTSLFCTNCTWELLCPLGIYNIINWLCLLLPFMAIHAYAL